jgi:peptide subunit release factor 1 (eRF1)
MNESELRAVLSELAVMRSNGEPIASLYLDLRWQDLRAREATRVVLRERIRAEIERHADHPAHEAVARTLERVQRAVTERREQVDRSGSEGLAIFACESLGLWRELTFDQPFHGQLSLDDRPYVLQLVRLLQGVQPIIVAVVHAKGVRVYQVALGGVLQQAIVEGPIPRGHREGGMSGVPGSRYERAQKNQRHIKELIERLRRTAATELTRLFDAAPASRIVLAGTTEMVASLERNLEPRVKDAVLARLPHPVSEWGDQGWVLDQVASEALDAVADEERRVEARAVDEVVGKALSGTRAVLGPEDVILAVNERRVERLMMEEDFAGWGWRCFNCDALGLGGTESCRYCGGEVTTVEDLPEELAGRVLAEEGEIEVVRHNNKLHSYRGTGALLRQSKGTGMRGGTPASPWSAPDQP